MSGPSAGPPAPGPLQPFGGPGLNVTLGHEHTSPYHNRHKFGSKEPIQRDLEIRDQFGKEITHIGLPINDR